MLEVESTYRVRYEESICAVTFLLLAMADISGVGFLCFYRRNSEYISDQLRRVGIGVWVISRLANIGGLIIILIVGASWC